jgi:polar amino acid transport system permease protein
LKKLKKIVDDTMDYLLTILPELMKGLGLTLEVFAITLVLSVPLGALFAFLLRVKVVNWVVNAFIWLMRGTPLLVQLIIIFYGLPMVGITIESRLVAALIAFVLNYSAYFAEIFRGGIHAIPKGQHEAAKVLQFTKFQTIRYIIMPQVVKVVLPSIFNEVINLVKDSSLVYVVGLSDLLRMGKIAMSRDVTLVPMLTAALIYLIVIGALTLLSKHVERKFEFYK